MDHGIGQMGAAGILAFGVMDPELAVVLSELLNEPREWYSDHPF